MCYISIIASFSSDCKTEFPGSEAKAIVNLIKISVDNKSSLLYTCGANFDKKRNSQ